MLQESLDCLFLITPSSCVPYDASFSRLLVLYYPFVLCTLCCQFLWTKETSNIRYTRQRKTKEKQTKETGNIGYTRRRKSKQKQSRETGNIVYTRRRKTKQKQSRETGSLGCTRRRKTKQKQSRETGNIGYTRRRKHNKNNPEDWFSCFFLFCFSSSCVHYVASFS
jgi:hypothetical protein